MPQYDSTRYDPPAPLATVALRNMHGGATVSDVILLVDTGADVTLLPRTAVGLLGVLPTARATFDLIGFDGTRSKAVAVDLDMMFLGRAYRGTYLVIESEHGVLGRDVLASVALVLDGPAQQWSQK